MKPHYFEQDTSDPDDIMLEMAKSQGYIPKTCLLGGIVVMDEIRNGRNPCAGCGGPREKCFGRPTLTVNHFQPGVNAMTHQDFGNS